MGSISSAEADPADEDSGANRHQDRLGFAIVARYMIDDHDQRGVRREDREAVQAGEKGQGHPADRSHRRTYTTTGNGRGKSQLEFDRLAGGARESGEKVRAVSLKMQGPHQRTDS